MIILTGDNLGERQKDLNFKVNEAAKENIDFTQLKTQTEKSDIDKLFKIDLAANYKNIDYILEIFKTGDNLCIARALKKCKWLCDDEFVDLISPKHLNDYVFPQMSTKMKHKLLCTLATHLENANIAIVFYRYCKENKITNAASKFLLLTPESYKFQIIKENDGLPNCLHDKGDYLKYFIGKSFNLAEKYLQILRSQFLKDNSLTLLKHMYSVSDEKYLDLLEKYGRVLNLGKRISKDILKKHKHRVLKNPCLYIEWLCKSMIAAFSTVEEVKAYAHALLPDTPTEFMRSYFPKYKLIFVKIPKAEIFGFLKNMFNEKYPDMPFEMSEDFYLNHIYEIMTEKERELWALRHIENGDEILGSGNDYYWYKFVNFDKALSEIKKYIHLTADRDKRIAMVNVLIDSVKTQNDAETLLDYFYKRHINEMQHHKEEFLDKLIFNTKSFKVFELNNDCWTALNKLFYSLDVYNNQLQYSHPASKYKIIALTYYIIHNEKAPDVLYKYAHLDGIKFLIRSNFLDDDKQQRIYDYLIKYHVEEVEGLSKEPYENVECDINSHIHRALQLMSICNRTKKDIPEIILKFIELDYEEYKFNSLVKENVHQKTGDDFKRYLKQDASLVVKEFPAIKDYITNRFGTTNWIISKLRIYFSNDIGQQYLTLLVKNLSDEYLQYSLAKVGVYGIFVLADEAFKTEFIDKYVPVTAKIDHVNMSRRTLYIQKAICGLASHSRPSLPLEKYMQYVAGDYVHDCLPVFNAYLVNLPPLQCFKFVENLINKPLSIQKHGVRLAFECFSNEHLIKLISSIWNKYKNTSIRKIIYIELYKKVVQESGEEVQKELFELLKKLTLDLHQDDDDQIFNLICSHNLQKHLVSELLEAIWRTVCKFPERTINYRRLTQIVKEMDYNITVISNEVLSPIIEEHVNNMINDDKITTSNLKAEHLELLKHKTTLLKTYLVYITNEKQLKQNLEIVQRIFKSSFAKWFQVWNEGYVTKKFVFDFIHDLESRSYDVILNYNLDINSFYYINAIFHQMLALVLERPEIEVYSLVWNLKLSFINRKIIAVTIKESSPETTEDIIKTIKTATYILADEFVNNVKYYKSDGKYYSSFYTQLSNILNNRLNNLMNTLVSNFVNKIPTPTDIAFDLEDVSIVFCQGLLRSDIREVIMFALNFIPKQYSDNSESEFLCAVKTLKAVKDDEIQALMYQKFVNEDFIHREFWCK